MMAEKRDEMLARRSKMLRWREKGGNYPNTFRRVGLASELAKEFGEKNKDELVQLNFETSVAGRLVLQRNMGKASFISLLDMSGQIQCYLTRDALGDSAYQEFLDLWDLGDIVGVKGSLMKTNKGELTVRATSINLLNKTLQPLPEKFHGLTDQETKYRQRYLDLLSNQEARELFKVRSKVVKGLREFFGSLGYLEVETPMMHPIPGGASARPFVTHHNALDMDLYLRVAPELYLKRLVVGGFERVFEINRNFRNEGLSTRHNPEFTMLEFYQAYSDYLELMDLTDDMLIFISQSVLNKTEIVYQGTKIDFARRSVRMTMAEAIIQYAGVKESELENVELLDQTLIGLGVSTENTWGLGKYWMEIFEAVVEKQLLQPTYITEYPAEVSPLARLNDRNSFVTDRFELFICGREYANGFSELNDPVDQTERFKKQVALKDSGDHEAMHFDEDYITALEYGLPPTAGEGVGIDRLVMLLTDSPSIRDVLLFPQMRPIN